MICICDLYFLNCRLVYNNIEDYSAIYFSKKVWISPVTEVRWHSSIWWRLNYFPLNVSSSTSNKTCIIPHLQSLISNKLPSQEIYDQSTSLETYQHASNADEGEVMLKTLDNTDEAFVAPLLVNSDLCTEKTELSMIDSLDIKEIVENNEVKEEKDSKPGGTGIQNRKK